LEGYRNVITHNPWGEYGHEEHVQVYRVLKELQDHLKFNLWVSNYYSNKSVYLMNQYMPGFGSEFITIKTNKKLARKIKNIYVKNKCWTWFSDYKWPDEELFIKDKKLHENICVLEHVFPASFIKIDAHKNDTHKRKRWLYFKGGIKKLFLKLSHDRNHIH
ncbi:MAG: hypothetical protein ACC707_18960, partial [Thiohalomonadales bacterium]